MKSRDSLGDRMKTYEAHECGRRFLPMLPVYARIDGRGFSRFTKDMERPYDARMSSAMVETTRRLVETTHASIGYTQSDEISLVWHSSDYEKAIFFDGKTTKMTSVLAGMTTSLFINAVLDHFDDGLRYLAKTPHFDSRVIQLPSQTEAANMVLWRELDATKNAISMAARHYYSHKELNGCNGPLMQEMLFQKGVNFNDYPPFFKRGSFIRRKTVMRPVIVAGSAAGLIERHEIAVLDMPKFSTVTNREAVIFDGADPMERVPS